MPDNPFDFTPDEPDEAPARRRRARGPDALAVIGLVLACTSLTLLLLAPLTCGVSAWAALPVSLLAAILTPFAAPSPAKNAALGMSACVLFLSLLATVGLVVFAAVLHEGGR